MKNRFRLLVTLMLLAGLGVVAGLVFWLTYGSTPRTEQSKAVVAETSGPPSADFAATALSVQNVEILKKLGSVNGEERLQALAPAFRSSESVQKAVAADTQTLELLPETFRVFDTYATVQARLSGKTVTFYLLPSDGLWLIAGQQ